MTLKQLSHDLDNRLTESEVIYGVRKLQAEQQQKILCQVMRGRFGSPPWLQESGLGGNKSQLARGGRKLGAAKVILRLLVIGGVVIAVMVMAKGSKILQTTLEAGTHTKEERAPRKICFSTT